MCARPTLAYNAGCAFLLYSSRNALVSSLMTPPEIPRSARRPRPSLPAGILVGLAFLGWTAEASAFCRSTTCRNTAAKQCETDPDGCVTEGKKLWWPTSCVSFATNERGTQDMDPEETRAVLRKTFQEWSEVPCPGGGFASMTFEERSPVECKRSEYNKTGPNVNVVLFQDDRWVYRGIDATLAKTSVTYSDTTGEIYDADIEINTANNTMTITDDPRRVQYDLQAIITHEVGHFIGIAHSPYFDAVMYASYEPGSTAERELEEDDIEAVCTIYPPNSGVMCNTTPKNGFSATCPDEEDSGLCSVSSVGVAGASAGWSSAGVFGVLLCMGASVAARRRGSRRGRSFD